MKKVLHITEAFGVVYKLHFIATFIHQGMNLLSITFLPEPVKKILRKKTVTTNFNLPPSLMVSGSIFLECQSTYQTTPAGGDPLSTPARRDFLGDF
ncbi:hypothetical protein [Vibrio vulnificus]|uniref:hypothetical protein n=1 Tax=Vibrio vulnificus TaxID=672 RepID=UPI001F2A103E|nr:hypothetical protein [Vibrio vulnificus]